MKKFAKISLITAGIFFVIGCVLCSVSAIAGGRSLVRTIREQEYLEEKMNVFADKLGAAVYHATGGNWGYIRDRESGLFESGESSEKIEADAVKNMELSLGAGTFIIEEKEEADGMIDISVSGIGNCNYYVKGETFYVKAFEGFHWIDWNGANENRIEIRVPKGSYFEKITIETGASVMKISDISVDKLEAETGAGELIMNRMNINQLNTEVGAGRMEASDIQTKDAEISVGMGECIFEGTITGNLDAECGMGNMELTLTGSETDHNYEIECAAGNVDVGSFSVSALASEKAINHNASSNFDIECGMGNVTIEFKD
ncbi:MAG: DUF4097 family beta strand repeat-containing protein [Suilimivivens sp.]